MVAVPPTMMTMQLVHRITLMGAPFSHSLWMESPQAAAVHHLLLLDAPLGLVDQFRVIDRMRGLLLQGYLVSSTQCAWQFQINSNEVDVSHCYRAATCCWEGSTASSHVYKGKAPETHLELIGIMYKVWCTPSF